MLLQSNEVEVEIKFHIIQWMSRSGSGPFQEITATLIGLEQHQNIEVGCDQIQIKGISSLAHCNAMQC